MAALARRSGASHSGNRVVRWALGTLVCFLVVGCGGAQRGGSSAAIPRELLRESRPIGRGPRFHPAFRGTVAGACQERLGPRFGVHVEVFAANRVVIVPAGIGTRPPRHRLAGRITSAGCFGSLVTLEPTGLILVREGATLSLADLFRAWGQPLSRRRLASFSAPKGREVRVFVGGQRWPRSPGSVMLTRHAEIVLEVGPHVPPHRSYAFPPGT